MAPAHRRNTATASGGQALSEGCRLEEFVIERVLGSGGFGITYLAHDRSLGRKVVLKENLPVHCAFRESVSGTVRPNTGANGSDGDFEWSMQNFEREATTLASLEHPNVIPVHRMFRANRTAYFVMPFLEGKPLDTLIEERRAATPRGFTEDELLRMLDPLLDALAYIHEVGVFHRDIKPGNILLREGGIPVLIDFGSARQKTGERSLTVVESPGYTPFEQLQSKGRLGPWSDLYSLGATFYKLVALEAPPKACDRMPTDAIQPLAARHGIAGRYSEELLKTIDRCLALDIDKRFPSASEMRDALASASPAQKGRNTDIRTENPPPPPEVTKGPSYVMAAEKLAEKALLLRDEGKLAEAAITMEEAARDWPEIRSRYGRMIELWKKGIQM